MDRQKNYGICVCIKHIDYGWTDREINEKVDTNM